MNPKNPDTHKKTQTPIVLVCVTNQKKCERLIHSGRRLADAFSLDLNVLSVEPVSAADHHFGSGLEHLFRVSVQNDAEMTVYYHDIPIESIKRHIERNNVRHIVVGAPPAPGDSAFIDGLLEVFPKIPVTIVNEAGDFFLAQSTPYERLSNDGAIA